MSIDCISGVGLLIFAEIGGIIRKSFIFPSNANEIDPDFIDMSRLGSL